MNFENQLITFRDSLSKAIMDELSKGSNIKLDVDSVRISDGCVAEYKGIFNNSV